MCDINTGIITIAMLLLSLCYVNYRKIKYSFFIIIFFTIQTVLFNQGTLLLIYILLLTYISRYANLSVLTKINFWMTFFFFFINLYLLGLGYVEVEYLDLSFKNKGIVSDLGYGNSNSLSIYIFYILISMYLMVKKKNLFLFLIIAIISYCAYLLSYSRTSLLCEIIFLLLCIIQRTKLKKVLYNRPFLYSIPIVVTLFIIYATYICLLDTTIDYLFSLRFSKALTVLGLMNWHDFVFGFIPPLEIPPLDIGYYALLIQSGILGVILFWLLYIKAVQKIDLDSPLLPVIITYIISCISEATMVSTYFFAGMYIWFILYRIAYPIYEKRSNNINNYTCL